MARLREAGVKIIATTVHGAKPADIQFLSEPVALLIGNEGQGVPADLHSEGRWSGDDSLPRSGREPQCGGGNQRAAL